MLHQNAILLVAGCGNRLAPLTDSQPKPLTPVNGVSILQNALDNLAAVGVKRVYLVTGYLRKTLIEAAKAFHSEIEVHEIYSDKFLSTNNMYSLYIAGNILSQGCLLLEGDVFFDKKMLPLLNEQSVFESYWLADIFTEEHDGSMLITDEHKKIESLEIIRSERPENYRNKFKSTGILSISSSLGAYFVKALERHVFSGKTDIYYDLVLKSILDEVNLHVLNISGCLWYEIDDHADLKKAEHIFNSSQTDPSKT